MTLSAIVSTNEGYFIWITILQVYLKFHFVHLNHYWYSVSRIKKGKSEVNSCIHKQTFLFKPVMKSTVVYTDVYAVFYKKWLGKPVGKKCFASEHFFLLYLQK